MADTDFKYENESEDLFDFDEVAALPTEPDASVAALDSIGLEELVAALPDIPQEELTGTTPLPDSGFEAFPPEVMEAENAGPQVSAAELLEELEISRDALGARRATPPVVIAIVVLVTVLNIVLLGLSWRTSTRIEGTINEVGLDIIRTAQGIREENDSHENLVEGLSAPIVSPMDGEERAFEMIRTDLENGDYGTARKRIYGVLATADRFEEVRRRDIEARAMFMLADTLVIEANALKEVSE